MSINVNFGTTECNYANIRTVAPDETNVSLKQGRQFAALSSRSVDHGRNSCVHMHRERRIRDHKLYIFHGDKLLLFEVIRFKNS